MHYSPKVNLKFISKGSFPNTERWSGNCIISVHLRSYRRSNDNKSEIILHMWFTWKRVQMWNKLDWKSFLLSFVLYHVLYYCHSNSNCGVGYWNFIYKSRNKYNPAKHWIIEVIFIWSATHFHDNKRKKKCEKITSLNSLFESDI